MGKLLDFAAELIRSLLKPVLDWLLRQPWYARVCALLVVLLLALGCWRWEAVSAYAVAGWLVGSDLLAGGKHMPLTRGDMARIHNAVDLLSPVAKNSLMRACGPPIADSWAAAQTTLALGLSDSLTREMETRTIFNNMESAGGWKQLPGNHQPVNVAISAWITYSLTRQDVDVGQVPLHFLLGSQSTYGWWPVFTGATADSFASTYSTAWCLLALSTYGHDRTLLPAARDSLARACERAGEWLLNNRDGQGASWKDYPYYAGRKSVSNSGLIVHALLESGARGGAGIARLWGDAPPTGRVEMGAREQPVGVFVRVGNEFVIDDTGYGVLPWVLIANEDAYRYCSLRGKIALTRCTRQALAGRWARDGRTVEEEWMAWETLLALKYIECRRRGGAETGQTRLGLGCRSGAD